MDRGLSFNLARSPLWKAALKAVAKYGPSYIPPSCNTLRTSLLKKVKLDVNSMLDDYRINVARTGCTICSDGWTDVNSRPLLNLLQVSPDGAVFLNAINTEGKTKSKTSKTLLKPGETRFASAFIVLQRLLEIIAALEPLIKVLRLVDGNHPTMGKLYQRMMAARETLQASILPGALLHTVLDRFEVRWKMMKTDLLCAGFMLDPEFRLMNQHEQEEVMDGFYNIAEKVFPSQDDQKRNKLRSMKARDLVWVFSNIRLLQTISDAAYEEQFAAWDSTSLGDDSDGSDDDDTSLDEDVAAMLGPRVRTKAGDPGPGLEPPWRFCPGSGSKADAAASSGSKADAGAGSCSKADADRFYASSCLQELTTLAEKLDPSLLKDAAFCTDVEELWGCRQTHRPPLAPFIFWFEEGLELFTALAKQHHARRRASVQQANHAVRVLLATAELSLFSSRQAVALQDERDRLCASLQELEETMVEGAYICFSNRWRLVGERTSSSFFTRGKADRLTLLDMLTFSFKKHGALEECIRVVPGSISAKTAAALDAMVTKEELRSALFSMDPHHSLGKVGLTAHFWQHVWPTLREDYAVYCRHVLDVGEMGSTQRVDGITMLHKQGDLRST
eukprot:jgi/Chlat1/1879/Chrsp143S00768